MSPPLERSLKRVVDSSGIRTPSLSSAMVRLDPEDFINIRRVEFCASQRSHPFTTELRLVDTEAVSRDASGLSTLFGYIVEDGAPPSCSRFGEERETVIESSRPLDIANEPVMDDDPDWIDPPGVPEAALPHHSLITSAISRTNSAPVAPSRSTSAVHLAAEAALRCASRIEAGLLRCHSARANFSLPSRRPAPRLSSHVPAPSPLIDSEDISSLPTAALPNFRLSDCITFPAHSYEIVLILDTREVESKTSRDKFAEALEAKGVKVETRALRLGDMCWIARRLDGLGGEEDECVLDYVVERKRLDDLCMSISVVASRMDGTMSNV